MVYHDIPQYTIVQKTIVPSMYRGKYQLFTIVNTMINYNIYYNLPLSLSWYIMIHHSMLWSKRCPIYNYLMYITIANPRFWDIIVLLQLISLLTCLPRQTGVVHWYNWVFGTGLLYVSSNATKWVSNIPHITIQLII